MKKLLAFVTTANQFLLFLAVLLIISVAGKNLVSELFEPSYDEPKVKIIEESGEAPSIVQVEYNTIFEKEILDVYVFDVSSTSIKIKSEQKLEDGMLNMFSGGERDIYQKVNLLFVPKSGSSYLLMKNDAYIAKVSYYDESIEEYRYKPKLSRNLYLVIPQDTNADGFLSEDDAADLYVSDYNGKDMNVVLKGVEDYKLIHDNLIMIEVRAESYMTFYTYELLTKKLLKLDTRTPLTSKMHMESQKLRSSFLVATLLPSSDFGR